MVGVRSRVSGGAGVGLGLDVEAEAVLDLAGDTPNSDLFHVHTQDEGRCLGHLHRVRVGVGLGLGGPPGRRGEGRERGGAERGRFRYRYRYKVCPGITLVFRACPISQPEVCSST